MGPNAKKLIEFVKGCGAIAAYADIIQAGFHKNTLISLVDKGDIEKMGRALYRLPNAPALSNPDLVTASLQVSRGVVCLLSALAFHEATDEIPGYVDLAIPRGTHANKIDYPPVRYYRFSPEAWKVGIEEHKTDGHVVRIYSLAKTVADCFKFRNKIGAPIARDALKVAVMEKRVSPKEIMYFAKICRVANIIKPILETVL